MKRIITGIAFLLAGIAAGAQSSCYPEGVVFSNQGQINGFHSTNPGCTHIEGDLTISGYNITNLDSLNGVIQIDGSLRIESNEVLGSLEGLSTLMYIGSNLYLAGNLVLPDLTGLEQVFWLGGDLMITDNPSLVTLTGLEGLTSITKRLYVDDNDALVSLDGLENVTAIGGAVRIISNDVLTSLSGLGEVTSVGGMLTIGGLGHLGSLGNPMLTSIEALSSLTSVGGAIEIGYNISLPSLAGIDNITPGSITGLMVFENSSLSECEVTSICSYLAYPGSDAEIYNNAPGCNYVEEVLEACLLIPVADRVAETAPSLSPNPAGRQLRICLPRPWHDSRITVSDAAGRMVLDADHLSGDYWLNTDNLAGGIYLVRVTGSSAPWSGRFIKQ